MAGSRSRDKQTVLEMERSKQWDPIKITIGPVVLFNLFTNVLGFWVSSITARFADDTKLFRIQISMTECEKLWRNLSKLGEWSIMWGIKFYVSKCKGMHFGAKKSPNFKYMLMGSELAETKIGRDFGTIMESFVKMSTH